MPEDKKSIIVEGKLTWEALIAMMQGQPYHCLISSPGITEMIEVILYPPFDGVFLTREQVREIEYRAEMSVFSILKQMQKNKEG